MAKKNTQGLTAKKNEDFSEWYTQLIQKAELIEYSPVSGCYILRPNAFQIWEKLQAFFNDLIKKDGVKNAYFPLFIPESYLTKEEDHIEGFAAEVAWVTHGGNSKLSERLAIRPTSETIMYGSYAKWIRSYKDLPLRLNQWSNVVRWEFSHCTPFLRSREFLLQEGHTAFATKEEAEKEVLKILDFYEKVYADLFAIPVLKGLKSVKEKFAGADYTTSIEAFLPDGKAIQGATSHHLGQNFAKVFDIKFRDKDEKEKFVYQNSWGFTTRTIGVAILMHSDDKGLVLPPKVATMQVVIVPILFDDSKKKVLAAANSMKSKLEDLGLVCHVDSREEYRPGWKFNEWEVKGIPLRIEIGPRDLDKNIAMVARRDTGEKQEVNLDEISNVVPKELEQMHKDLFEKAKKHLEESVVEVKDVESAKKAFSNGKYVFASWCGSVDCEEKFKEETLGKSLNSPIEQEKVKGKCFACDQKAKVRFYFGRSY
jgi:prolyl-tRNA synthetase